jgi:hypothetical protein
VLTKALHHLYVEMAADTVPQTRDIGERVVADGMFDEGAGLCADAAAGKRSIDVSYEAGPELKKFAANVDGTGKPIAATAGAAAHHQPPQSESLMMTTLQLPMVAENVVLGLAVNGECCYHTDGRKRSSQRQNATTDGDDDDEKANAAATAAEPTKDQTKRAREIRLEQNRKAARESRRRKKVMIEELQRSVIFFSRANATLKQQNDELARILMRAQAKIKAVDEGREVASPVFVPAAAAVSAAAVDAKPAATATTAASVAANIEQGGIMAAALVPKDRELDAQSQQEQQAQAQAVATQAIFESQGFPAAAARMAAQTMNAGGYSAIPPMQPGATMQAMANFQTACAQAMQAAIQGMQSVPGLNLSQMQILPTHGANMQQAYTDQMTALAMQQAAAAQMGAHHFLLAAPLLAGNAMWAANSAVAAATAAAANHSANVTTASQPQQHQLQGQPPPAAPSGSTNDGSTNA